MTHLAALVSGYGWHVQDLLRAAKKVGVRLDALPFPSVVGRVNDGPSRVEAGGVDLGRVDAVIVRMMPPGSLERVVFRMDALHRLAALGVPVVNPPGAVEASVDKYLSLARLEAAGLPVPPTWVGERADGAMEAFERLGGDVVFKPIFGAEGRGLVRVGDVESCRRVARALEQVGAVLYVQKFIENPGHDLRVFVLGGRVLGAIRRHAPPGDWRANVAVGGRAEGVSRDDEAASMALAASSAVGALVAGVDLLPGDSGLSVVEVNAVPGWRALAGATGVDVAAELTAFVADRAYGNL